MTTLPSNTRTTTTPTEPSTRIGGRLRPTVGSVRLAWRVLRRSPEAGDPRGGQVRASRVEVELAPNLVTIRRLDGDAEVSAIVLPARAGRQSTPAGDLLEWWCGDDAAGPECRVFVSPDREPLVRSRLLDRLGIQGGTHELKSIEFESANRADGVGTPAGS